MLLLTLPNVVACVASMKVISKKVDLRIRFLQMYILMTVFSWRLPINPPSSSLHVSKELNRVQEAVLPYLSEKSLPK